MTKDITSCYQFLLSYKCHLAYIKKLQWYVKQDENQGTFKNKERKKYRAVQAIEFNKRPQLVIFKVFVSK